MKLFTSLFFFLFLINNNLSAQFADDTKIDLHLNLLPGDTYLYSVSMNQNIVQEIMGEPLEINQQIKTDYSYLVESNDGDLFKIKVNYERIQLTFDAPQGKVEYDSEQSSNNSSLAAINDLIGKPFYVLMNTKGKISKIEGFNELTKNLNLTDPIKQFLTDSALIQSLTMDIYSDQSVEMGDSWNKSKTINLANLKLQSNLTYTLEGTSEDLAWLNVTGDISAINNDPNFEMEITATQNGTIETDINSGMISSGNIKIEMDATLKSQGFDIPMKIISEIKTEGRKL